MTILEKIKENEYGKTKCFDCKHLLKYKKAVICTSHDKLIIPEFPPIGCIDYEPKEAK